MKKYIVTSCLTLVFILLFSSCDDATTLPPLYPEIYSENFSPTAVNEPSFNFQGWLLFSQTGTKSWFLDNYQDNDYIEFNPYGSKESSNIGWAITPVYNLELLAQKALIFQSAQHNAISSDNKFELLVSTNFNGTDVLNATWIPLSFKGPEYSKATNYVWVNSGKVNLSDFSGTIYIAFRVTGNSTTRAGGFQVDNIKLF